MAQGKDEQMKWIGALLVIISCGGMGILLAAAYRREERLLRQMLESICWMECELGCRATELSGLFAAAAQRTDGRIGQLFDLMADNLAQRIAPDALVCMNAALSRVCLPEKTACIATKLGRSLGEFHLQEQLRQLTLVREECTRLLEEHTRNRDNRIRSYHTLWLCAGVALVILLI